MKITDQMVEAALAVRPRALTLTKGEQVTDAQQRIKRESMRERLEAALEALPAGQETIPDDWVLVPKHATIEMANAAFQRRKRGKSEDGDVGYIDLWAAMLSAAPKPPHHSADARNAVAEVLMPQVPSRETLLAMAEAFAPVARKIAGDNAYSEILRDINFMYMPYLAAWHSLAALTKEQIAESINALSTRASAEEGSNGN